MSGEYVACPACGGTQTRVELEFENGEQILWCGHHRMRPENEPTQLLQRAEKYVAKNVDRFGQEAIAHDNVVKLVADLASALKARI